MKQMNKKGDGAWTFVQIAGLILLLVLLAIILIWMAMKFGPKLFESLGLLG